MVNNNDLLLVLGRLDLRFLTTACWARDQLACNLKSDVIANAGPGESIITWCVACLIKCSTEQESKRAVPVPRELE